MTYNVFGGTLNLALSIYPTVTGTFWLELAWICVLYTYAGSHIDRTDREACSAANKAAANKIVKYGTLSASHLFQWQLRLPAPGTSPTWADPRN